MNFVESVLKLNQRASNLFLFNYSGMKNVINLKMIGAPLSKRILINEINAIIPAKSRTNSIYSK